MLIATFGFQASGTLGVVERPSEGFDCPRLGVLEIGQRAVSVQFDTHR